VRKWSGEDTKANIQTDTQQAYVEEDRTGSSFTDAEEVERREKMFHQKMFQQKCPFTVKVHVPD
jgi:hypothetical protein